MGVPRTYCDCDVCQEARSTCKNARLRSSVMLQTEEGERLLIDCGPDWRAQMERFSERIISRTLLTHPHHDHIGGLPDLADVARWTERKIDVYAPEWVLKVVRRQYPWTSKSLRYIPFDEYLVVAGWRIKGWTVDHGRNGESTAYRFERDGRSWVYCPDSIHMSEAQWQPMKGVDLLVLGTSFWHEQADVHKRSIYDVQEALSLIEAVSPRKVWLTHLSHGIDVVYRQSQLPDGVHFAADGTIVRV